MSKFKTILFWILVGAALGAAIWSYFYLRQNKKPALQAIDVLPDSALCVISSNNFPELTNKLSNQNLVWQEAVNVKEFSDLNTQLIFFDSVITENENLRSFFNSRSLHLALYREDSRNVCLIAFNLNEMAQEKDFLKEAAAALKTNVKEDASFDFKCDKINYNLTCKRGVVLISNDRSYSERAFNEARKKQNANKDFSGLKKLLDKENICNVYADHRLIRSRIGTQNGKPLFTGASVFDVQFDPSEVTFNGFNAPDSSSILNSLSGQQAQTCDFFNYLPFDLVSYKAVGVSDYLPWRKKMNTAEEKISQYWKMINDSALFNVQKELEENIAGRILEVKLRFTNVMSKALLVEIKDSSSANEVLHYISDTVIVTQNLRSGKLKPNALTETICGNMFGLNAAYVFVSERFLVITENKETNDHYLNSILNNATITQNELFMAYAKDNLAQSFNFQYYCSLGKDPSAIGEGLEFVKNEQLKVFGKLSDLSISLSNYKNVLQFRSNVKYQQNNHSKEIPGLWTFEADTLINSKVWTFTNHKSGENELLIQDAKNDLYLINATGNALWKKQINEQIVSEIYTVDAFKNKKFQMLFHTANYLHLIDRNGNYVEGFPVKLPAAATNQMSLFDYENTRDYRIFIACADKNIYNLNINGTRNESFAPVKTLNEVSLPVKYARVGASDYLISADVAGKIYVFSRRGAGRIDFSNSLLEHCSNYFVDAANNIQNSRLIYFDEKNSLLESISLEDKKSVVKLNGEFEETSYSFDWIDDDKKPDIMILDRSKLKCFDLAGNELFGYENPDYTYKTVSYFYDTDGSYFLLGTLGGEVHLIPAGTKTIAKKIKGNGIPLVFDLFKDGKKYLLISDETALKCVLLK